MALLALLNTNCVKVPLEGNTKEEVLREMVDLLDKAGGLTSRNKALEAILDRERLGSTGLEKGIAIPHAKTDAAQKVQVVIGVKPQGVDFQSLDGEPTKIFFLILAPPEQVGQHIEILSEIAKVTKSAAFCRLLVAARSPEEVIELFQDD